MQLCGFFQADKIKMLMHNDLFPMSDSEIEAALLSHFAFSQSKVKTLPPPHNQGPGSRRKNCAEHF